MMLRTWKSQFQRKHFSLDYGKPALFICAQWQQNPKPNLLYLVYRWLVSFFFIISWIFSIIDLPHLNEAAVARAKWLIYLTNWGYTMCFIQSCICTVTLTISFLSAAPTTNENATEEKSMVLLYSYKLYWVANIIATDFALAITIIYWSLIYNENETPLNTMNIIVHGMNSFVMLIEVWVVAHPVRILHFYIPVLFGLLYVIFSIIYYSAGGTNKKEQVYIYTILNWANPGKTVLVCLGVTVFLIMLHFFVYGMYRLRKIIYERLRAIKKKEEAILQLNYKSPHNNPVASSTDSV